MSEHFSLLGVLLVVVGCGTDVAQTARRPAPSAPLDCTPSSRTVTLPSEPELGGGDTITDSPLVGGTYGAGQGPGLAVVARDGFRVYQNEALVAESTASFEPVFVPLTFLPGDNAVTVVATSPDRAPLVLVHVDELEKPYVSDGGWKVSTSPSGEYLRPDYDASGWSNAVDHGLALATAGCEPPPGFVSGSEAHWIGAPDEAARTAVFRLSFRIAAVGYGAATTGGGNAEPVVTADRDELAGLLIADGPSVILVPEGILDLVRTGTEVTSLDVCPTPCDDGSGKIVHTALPDMQTCAEPLVSLPRDERHLGVSSNKTLVGLGRGAYLRGLWLSATAADNVIVRNVALYDVNPGIIEGGDGFSIDGSARVWLDHMTFRWIGDGFVDGTTSSDVTLSWIHFDGHSEFACGERHPRANELGDTTATVHHSFYDSVTGRAPTANHALSHVHVYNDFVRDDPDYAVGAACGAEVLLEGSYFENVRFPTSKRDCSDDPSLGRVSAPEGSNRYDDASGPHQSGGADAQEPHDAISPLPYEIMLDPAGDVRFTVRDRAGAGSRWALPFDLK